MLESLLDKVTGMFSRKWLIGRRLVVDFTESNERRISIVCLPEDSFSFDLRPVTGTTGRALLLVGADGTTKILATFEDEDLAERALRSLRFAILRPIKKLVMFCLGAIIVLFALDLAGAHSGRSAPKLADTGPAAIMGGGAPKLTAEQMAMIRDRLNVPPGASNQVPSLPAAVNPTPASTPQTGSSPEAQAALEMLRGK